MRFPGSRKPAGGARGLAVPCSKKRFNGNGAAGPDQLTLPSEPAPGDALRSEETPEKAQGASSGACSGAGNPSGHVVG